MLLTFDDNYGIIEQERKRVIEMRKSVNSLIRSLPRIVEKKVWKVTDSNGTVVQGVSASDNRKSTAQAYIDAKYPGRDMTLSFSHFGGMIVIPQ